MYVGTVFYLAKALVKIFDNRDFLREALFLWMMFFLAALSRAAKDSCKAFLASSALPAVIAFLSFLVAFLILSKAARFVIRRLMFCLAALMADFVLGIVEVSLKIIRELQTRSDTQY